MRTFCVFVCSLAACASLVDAAYGDSAYAPLGSATRYTDLKGSVQLQEGKDGVEVVNDLRAADANKTYDVYLLAAGCPANAPLDESGKEKLKQAAKSGQKLGSLKGDGQGSLTVKGLSVKAALSRGILLIEGGAPIECADVTKQAF
jgi:hypothetical protein